MQADESGGVTVFYSKLGEDFLHVTLHRMEADAEDHPNLRIAFPLSQPFENLALPGRQRFLGSRTVAFLDNDQKAAALRVLGKLKPQYRAASDQFDEWLVTTLSDPVMPRSTQEQALANWEAAPYARFCHPREEHLLPLHLCFGAASQSGELAEVLFNEGLMGHKVAGFGWSE